MLPEPQRSRRAPAPEQAREHACGEGVPGSDRLNHVDLECGNERAAGAAKVRGADVGIFDHQLRHIGKEFPHALHASS